MNFYDNKKNVEEYLKMAEGYDGRELIQQLNAYIPSNSKILELGMGPGKDFLLLNQKYDVLGSDSSEIFIDMFLQSHPSSKVQVLNAITIETDEKFDGIYSNKVLMHLTKEEFTQSISRQWEILNPNGMICHSFWYGEQIEKYNGLLFVYYTENELKTVLEKKFEIVQLIRYKEMEPNDSLLVIARKKV